jgi:hypothetical protein
MKKKLNSVFLSMVAVLITGSATFASPGDGRVPAPMVATKLVAKQFNLAPFDMKSPVSKFLFSTLTIKLKSSNARTSYTDTITNAIAKSQHANFGFSAKKISIQTTITKITGTVAGIVTLEASNDGIGYNRINLTDSLILKNQVSNVKIFTVPNPLHKYYQIKVTPSGTQSSKLNSLGLAEF